MRLLAGFGALIAMLIACFGLVVAWDARELQRPWPMGLGSLRTLPLRFPPEEDNAAATRLIALAAPMGIDFHYRAHPKQPIDDAISAFLRAQLTRADDTLDAPPPDVAAFLRQHDADLVAVRTHLMSNRIIWRSNLHLGAEGPIPNLLAHIRLTRCLIARALTASDPDDLHAAWLFASDIWRRSDEISRLVALAEMGMIDAAMRKLPASAWRNDIRSFDVRRAMIEAFELEAWVGHYELRKLPPTSTSYAAVMRRAAAELSPRSRWKTWIWSSTRGVGP
jgi:hypothetical protein